MAKALDHVGQRLYVAQHCSEMRQQTEKISDVVDTTISKTQKKRDLVQEEVTNSKLTLQKTTYGSSYAIANTINSGMGWHLEKF